MPGSDTESMARGRALLTEREREHLREHTGDAGEYEAVSRLRARLSDELTADVAVLREHRPELLTELQAVVCDD